MSLSFLDNTPIGDDGRNATGRTFDFPLPGETEAGKAAMAETCAMLEAAAVPATHDCDLARIAYWELYPIEFEKFCRKYSKIWMTYDTEGRPDPKRLTQIADDMAALPLIASEARDCRALRLYAGQVRQSQFLQAAE